MLGFLRKLFRRGKSLKQLENEDFFQDLKERGYFEESKDFCSNEGRDSTAVADSEDSNYED